VVLRRFAVGYYKVKLQRSDALVLDRRRGACDEASFTEWCEKKSVAGNRLAVDLFSGAGGLSLGLEDAGWTVAVAVDFDQRAIETHQANFPGLALKLDLGDPAQRDHLKGLLKDVKIDLVAGGPPCQPFSRAGRSKIRSLVLEGSRDEVDLRKELWRAYIDVVLAVRPRVVLMENVPDMALGDGFSAVREIVELLERADYHTEVRLVDAWKYGVPQHRKRLILLARLDGDEFPWPAEQKTVTLEDAIYDLPVLDPDDEGTPLGAREMARDPDRAPSKFAKSLRAGSDRAVVWDHMTRGVRLDDIEVFKLMKPDTLYSAISEDLRRYSAETFDDKYKRLDWNKPSRSITAHIAKDGYWYIHPESDRTLTVREAARVQTFPDRFRFAGTRSDAFRQIGNAVPPRLGTAAATALKPQVQAQGEAPAARPTNRWLAARERLVKWAEWQQVSRYWFNLPGPSMTPAVASLTTLLLHARAHQDTVRDALAEFRGRQKLVKADFTHIGHFIGESQSAKALGKLEALTRAQKIWSDPEKLAAEVLVSEGQRQHFRLLLGEDVMLTSQTSLRVAARVCGNETDKTNRLTDGRVDIARLIGSGVNAPLRMAALRLIGTTMCVPEAPKCGACPLATWCAFKPEAPQEALFDLLDSRLMSEVSNSVSAG